MLSGYNKLMKAGKMAITYATQALFATVNIHIIFFFGERDLSKTKQTIGLYTLIYAKHMSKLEIELVQNQTILGPDG